jgi:hypothetical protein
MISRTTTSGGSSLTTKYSYDVSGAQVGVNTTTSPLWAQLDGSGNITERYLTGAGGALMARSGSLTDGTAWLLTDRQGSVRDVVNASGTLEASVSYGAFGNITSQTSGASSWLGNYGWQGLFADGALGVNMAKYRFVLPDGQWSGKDPLSFGAGDANLQRVVGNNTANAVDPSGLAEPNLFQDLEDRMARRRLLDSAQSRATPQRVVIPVIRCATCHSAGEDGIPPAWGGTPTAGQALALQMMASSPVSFRDATRYLGEVYTEAGIEIANGADQIIYQPAKRTIQMGEYFIRGWDPEFETDNPLIQQYNRGEISWWRAVLCGTADVGGTITLVNPATNLARSAVSKTTNVFRVGEQRVLGVIGDADAALVAGARGERVIQSLSELQQGERLIVTAHGSATRIEFAGGKLTASEFAELIEQLPVRPSSIELVACCTAKTPISGGLSFAETVATRTGIKVTAYDAMVYVGERSATAGQVLQSQTDPFFKLLHYFGFRNSPYRPALFSPKPATPITFGN